jgi:hypothetical protein
MRTPKPYRSIGPVGGVRQCQRRLDRVRPYLFRPHEAPERSILITFDPLQGGLQSVAGLPVARLVGREKVDRFTAISNYETAINRLATLLGYVYRQVS